MNPIIVVQAMTFVCGAAFAAWCVALVLESLYLGNRSQSNIGNRSRPDDMGGNFILERDGPPPIPPPAPPAPPEPKHCQCCNCRHARSFKENP